MTRSAHLFPARRAHAAAAALLIALTPAALAQDEKQPEPAPTPPPAKPLPDLDDLLGLPADTRDDADRPRADIDRADLERRLSAQQISEAFEEAVIQMRDVADALRVTRDTGLRTQRTQEEIILKLDMLIKQAEQNQQQSQSQSQAQQRPRPQEQQQAPSQQQPSQSQQETQGDNTQEGTPPGGRDARLNEFLDAAQAAWGALPPRVRDVLMQGSADRFSSLYESMTESYYRRLAEEGRRE